MSPTFRRNTLVLVLLSSLHIIGPVFVSSEEPSCGDTSKIVVGAKVVRGKDWGWGSQDGTPPTQGTVLRGLLDGWVRVQWANNHTNSYRMGSEGKCDLDIVEEITEPTVPSSPSTTQSTSYSSSVTTPLPESSTSSFSVTSPLPESSTSSSPPSPTCHQCTCSKEISESQARIEAETAELAKEAARLAVEVGKLSIETAKVALEAAKATARAEEAKAKEAENAAELSKVALEAANASAKEDETKRLLEVETMKLALEVARSVAIAEIEAKQVYLEVAKSIAKAEESWAANAAEEVQFERDRRNRTLQSVDSENI